MRPLYVFEKTVCISFGTRYPYNLYLIYIQVATFGTFALLYTVTESFILPYTPRADQSFLRSLLDLALPFMIAYLLLFYIIFGGLFLLNNMIFLRLMRVVECICNGFAELS